MRRFARSCTLAALVALLLLTLAPHHAAAATPETLLTVRASLTELESLLNRLQGGVDEITANKIEAAANEARAMLREIDGLIAEGERAGNEVVNDVLMDAHRLTAELGHLARSTERTAFLDLNSSLSTLSRTLDAVPLVDVEPYLSAVEPMRVDPDESGREIRLYGWFGPRDPSRPVKVLLADLELEAREAAGALTFVLPRFPGGLKEESHLEFALQIPTRSGIFRRKTHVEVRDRLYVQRKQPFACRATTFQPNPEHLVTVKADKEFTDQARTQSGGSTPSVTRTVSARDLFIATVSTALDQYDPDTAKIQVPGERFWGNSACGDHAGWSGNIRRWNQDLVDYQLHAPSIGPHQHSGTKMEDLGILGKHSVPYTYLHGGGGSHANIGLRPTFLVARKGTPALRAGETTQAVLGRRDTTELMLPVADQWTVHVTCEYRDGRERFETGPLVLTPTDSQETGTGIAARVSEGRLYLATIPWA